MMRSRGTGLRHVTPGGSPVTTVAHRNVIVSFLVNPRPLPLGSATGLRAPGCSVWPLVPHAYATGTWAQA